MVSSRKILIGGMSIVLVIFSLTLLVRLVDEAQLVSTFPLDYVNDISAYMGQLHFLKVCGYLSECPYWYNGFVELAISPPGWYFFAYPLLLVTGSVTAATYFSMIALLLLGLGACLFLAKRVKMHPFFGVMLFLFMYANALNIGNFLRLGRGHAFLTTGLSILFFAIIYPYHERKLDGKFFMASAVYAMMMVSHYQETVLFSLLFVSVFLTRRSWKERGGVVLAMVLAFVLASWWVVPFLRSVSGSSLLAFHEGVRSLSWSSEWLVINMLGFVLPMVVGFFFFIWWTKAGRRWNEFLFFLPVLVVAMVYLLRLHVFIPVLKNISPDPYVLFFLFFASFLFVRIVDRFDFSRKITYVCMGILIVLAIASSAYSLIKTPYFVPHTAVDAEVISVFPLVKDKFWILGALKESGYSKAYYAYASIYYNISTPEGWSPPLTSMEYLREMDFVEKNFANFSCPELKEALGKFNATTVLSYTPTCSVFARCGLKEIYRSADVCLYLGEKKE